MLKLRWCGAMVLGLISGARLMTAEPQATNALVVVEPPADVTLTLAADVREGAFTIERAAAGKARILVQGLKLGGHVEAAVEGRPVSVELLASGGLEAGRADQALIEADLPAGRSALTLKESEGAQVVRVRGTRLYFGTTSRAAGHALFSMDMTNMCGGEPSYPLTVYYGEDYKPFYWFNGGKLDCYYGEFFVATVHTVRASSGPAEATLSFEVDYPPRDLSYTTVLTLGQGSGTEVVPLRVRHIIRKTGPAKLPWNLEFLHLVINERYGLDWRDGVPDWFWHRVQVEDAPDTLPGSHTHYERMDDNSLRVFQYRWPGQPDGELVWSSAHHTSGPPMYADRNSIGGWFSKAGVGSIGLVWHRYEGNFRDNIQPVFGNCGDGADTHFCAYYLGVGTVGIEKAGDVLDIEYTLFSLPTELTYTDPDDLNEIDLLYFGKEREQRSQIVAFVGNRDCFGLLRSDGSMVLWGPGHRKPTRLAVPEITRQAAQRIYRMWDMGRPSYKDIAIEDGCVTVEPDSATIVDCGSALIVPGKYTPPPEMGLENMGETFFVALTNAGNRPLYYPWRQEPAPVEGRLGTLSGIGVGEVVYGGVRFRIDGGMRGIIALEGPADNTATNAPRRPPLPAAVEVPVNRPADVLFFLHALVTGGGFDYVLHYADGQDVTLPVRAGREIVLFREPYVWRFPEATDHGGRAALAAATWNLYHTGHGNVYRLEWAAPADRRSVPLRSIGIKAYPDGSTPLVLGITGAMKR